MNNLYKKPVEIKINGEVKQVSSDKLKKIWTSVNSFNNYEVSPVSGIRNAKTKKILKPRNWIGYPKVTLMSNGKKNEVRIHRIVAETFIPKKDPTYNIVNHKSGIRTDYSVHNLEWMNQSLNMKDRWKNAGKRPKYVREY